MNPNCPKCGRQMAGGAPHGPWAVQYECRRCGVYTQGEPIPFYQDPPPRLTEDEFNAKHGLGRGGFPQ